MFVRLRNFRRRLAKLEQRDEARLLSYLLRARRRIALRSQGLMELSLAWMVWTVLLAVASEHSIMLRLCGSIVYLAFGYMIWTILEEKADSSEGSGYRLMANPTRWRRNGLAFFHGFAAIVLAAAFCIIWGCLLFLVLFFASAGQVSFATVNIGHIPIPVTQPLWLSLVLLPSIVVPALIVHRALHLHMRRGYVTAVPRDEIDRILWINVIILGVIGYAYLRTVFLHFPYLLGQVFSSVVVLTFTIAIAACELSFLADHAKKQQEI